LLLPAPPTPLVPSQEDTRALLPAALFPPAIRAVPGRIPGGRQCPGSSAGAGFLEGQGRWPGPRAPRLRRCPRTSPGQVFPQKSFERLFHPEDVPNSASVAARARGTPHPGSASQVPLTAKTIRFCDFSYFAGWEQKSV